MKTKSENTGYLWGRQRDGIVLRLGSGLRRVQFIIEFHNICYISFCIYQIMCVSVLSCFSHVRLFVTLWTVAHQAPTIHGILQAKILKWVAMPSSMGSSQPRD